MARGEKPSAERSTGPTAGERLVWVLAALAAMLGGLATARWWHRQVPEPAVEARIEPALWVDPAEATLVSAPAWADPRWLERVQALVACLAPFPREDPRGLEELRGELARLSFVRGVARLEAHPARGLLLDLDLRRPVACIPVRGDFALVDEEGVVLEGRWPLPPRLGRAYLPVLGPLDDPLLGAARPGDWLVEPEHVDALAVALSLDQALAEDARVALGRIVIDARRARSTSIEEPGVRLELEGGRLALFGRSPLGAEPGELTPERKWHGLVQALEWFAVDPEANDWTLVDLRWDRPDLAPRDAAPALAQEARSEPRVAIHDGPPPREWGDPRSRVR